MKIFLGIVSRASNQNRQSYADMGGLSESTSGSDWLITIAVFSLISALPLISAPLLFTDS